MFVLNVDFLKIVVFRKENCYFLGFGLTNSMKIRRKIAFENIFVLNVDFLACFGSFLLILEQFWTTQNHTKFKTLPLGPSKNSPKSVQDDPKIDFGVCLGRIFFRRWVWEGFGRIFGGFSGIADHLLTLILLLWGVLEEFLVDF